jgi:hypothetical protein
MNPSVNRRHDYEEKERIPKRLLENNGYGSSRDPQCGYCRLTSGKGGIMDKGKGSGRGRAVRWIPLM